MDAIISKVESWDKVAVPKKATHLELKSGMEAVI